MRHARRRQASSGPGTRAGSRRCATLGGAKQTAGLKAYINTSTPAPGRILQSTRWARAVLGGPTNQCGFGVTGRCRLIGARARGSSRGEGIVQIQGQGPANLLGGLAQAMSPSKRKAVVNLRGNQRHAKHKLATRIGSAIWRLALGAEVRSARSRGATTPVPTHHHDTTGTPSRTRSNATS